MRDRLDEFSDAAVAVISFSAPAQVADYQRRQLAPLDVLVDEDRRAYAAFDLGRGSVIKVWGPKSWMAYGRLLRQGRHLQRPTEDTLQLGGDFVIDRDGRIAYAYRSEDPDDRPPVDTLLTAVRA